LYELYEEKCGGNLGGGTGWNNEKYREDGGRRFLRNFASRVLEVIGSNLGRDIGNHERQFSMFFSVPSGRVTYGASTTEGYFGREAESASVPKALVSTTDTTTTASAIRHDGENHLFFPSSVLLLGARGSWFRHCSTSRKVEVSIPDEVIGFFN
jgi:hypothetical protein